MTNAITEVPVIGHDADATPDTLGSLMAVRSTGRIVGLTKDEWFWARAERDEMRNAARDLGVGIELHYLDVPTKELWRRIEARNSEPPWDSHPIRRADLEGWASAFQAPDDAELALFDPLPRVRRAT